MNNNKISIIVPIYNVDKYLCKCIESIICQTYKNIEIILIDDGSTDNCPQICDEYALKDKRIIVIHKENGGQSDARNVGIDMASGEYIIFVDSDDYIAEDYVEYLYELIDKSGSDISICDMCMVNDEGIISERPKSNTEKILTPEQALKIILYQREFDVSPWGKLYKAQLFEGTRFPSGKIFEDFAIAYKIIDKCHKIIFGAQVKYFYYQRDGSTMLCDFKLRNMDLIKFSEEMVEYITKRYPNLKQAAIRRDLYSNYHILRQMIYCKPRYKQEEKKIIKHINTNSKIVLVDKNAPAKDKISIISLYFGTGFFKLSWNVFVCFFR